MEDRGARIDRNLALASAVVVIVIIYGSLYPFHFHSSSGDPLRALMETWRGPFGRGDFLANILFYFPLGLFSLQALHRWPLFARIALVMIFGCALSVSMELIQFYDEGRASALSDVYANTIGVAFGSAASPIVFRGRFRWRFGIIDWRPFVILLAGCWLGYTLFPYVPVIDLHKYWEAVKPLVYSPAIPPLDAYRHTVVWLVVALLIEALTGTARSRIVLALLVLAVLFAKILIVDTELSRAEVLGSALAPLLWYVFLSRWRGRAALIAALFAGVVVMDALQPFEFSAQARPFGWIPFRGFINGSVEQNFRSFLEKVFTYGSLTWLIARAGARFSIAVGFSAGLVLCLRLLQVFVPGRSAEITDVILLLIVACAMKLMGEDPKRVAA